MTIEIKALLTGNRRDVSTAYPKVLLTKVNGFHREHCWVDLTKDIEKIQPKGHQNPIKIKAVCKIKKYIKNNEEKETLYVKKVTKIK